MAEPKDSKPKKRRLVKNPETFRERAIKASESEDSPAKSARLKTAARKISAPIAKPAGLAIRRVPRVKPTSLPGKLIRLIGHILFPVYFRNSWKELKQVTWPSWKQSRQLTFAVIVFAVVFGAAIAVVDFGLDKLFRNVLLK